jgi:hypothetical protein
MRVVGAGEKPGAPSIGYDCNVEETPRRRALKSIDTPLGTFELLEGNVIFWTVALGTVLDERTAREAYASVGALASGEPVAIIGDARGLGFADRKARDVLAASEIPGRVATGVIVSSAVIRVLANQYAKQVGDRPFQVFSSEADAIEWGLEQVQQVSNG